MPQEVAINVPFDAAEIKDIACQELRKRLDQLSPLMGMKEYARFELDFQVKIKVWRTGEQLEPKHTLAWGHAEKGEIPEGAVSTAAALNGDVEPKWVDAAESSGNYTADDPNTERLKRDMPLTVESTDGRGGKTRKKVRIKE